MFSIGYWFLGFGALLVIACLLLESERPRSRRPAGRALGSWCFRNVVFSASFCYNTEIMFRRISSSLPAALVLTIIPQICLAGTGADYLAIFIKTHIIQQAMYAFIGISAAFLLYYAFRMIVEAQKEQTITDARRSFINALVGFAVIAIGGGFMNALSTSGFSLDNVTDIKPDALLLGINSVSTFLTTGAEGIFVLIITIVGIRMMLTQGDSAEFTKLTKVLVANIIGVVVMLTANIIITAIAGQSSANIIGEVVGIILFLLTILGFACAVALIIAGILLIISIDESLKDKAKKIIIGTLITLVIVLALGAIIQTFAVTGSGPSFPS